MARRPFTVTLAFVALGLLLSVPASAQPLGTFRVAGFERLGLRSVTRLAISPKGDRMAVVAPRP
mgnify:CR=1 FL=1